MKCIFGIHVEGRLQEPLAQAHAFGTSHIDRTSTRQYTRFPTVNPQFPGRQIEPVHARCFEFHLGIFKLDSHAVGLSKLDYLHQSVPS